MMFTLVILCFSLVNFVSCNQEFGQKCAQESPHTATDKNATAYRIGNNSKFAFINISAPLTESHFEKSVNICKSWGLDVAQIKHHKDIKNIELFLSPSISNNGNTTFWISGTDKGHENRWTYNETGEDFYYHAFWGFSPINIPTEKNHESADNVQLHWTHDTFGNGKWVLVMMDVEDKNKFYKSQSIICQYMKETPCFINSDEEKVFKEAQSKNDQLELLGDIGGDKKFYVSYVQKNLTGALKLCKSQKKQVLNLELEIEAEATKFFGLLTNWMDINELTAGVTGFWVGNNNLFSPITAIQWEWIDNSIRDPANDQVLMYMKQSVREGPPAPAYGRCLAVGILHKGATAFNLQRVPCDLPQWVICTDGEEIVSPPEIISPPKQQGRGMVGKKPTSKQQGNSTAVKTIVTTTPKPITTTTSKSKTTIATTKSPVLPKGKVISTTTTTTTKRPLTPKGKGISATTTTKKPAVTTTAKPTSTTTKKPSTTTTPKGITPKGKTTAGTTPKPLPKTVATKPTSKPTLTTTKPGKKLVTVKTTLKTTSKPTKKKP